MFNNDPAAQTLYHSKASVIPHCTEYHLQIILCAFKPPDETQLPELLFIIITLWYHLVNGQLLPIKNAIILIQIQPVM